MREDEPSITFGQYLAAEPIRAEDTGPLHAGTVAGGIVVVRSADPFRSLLEEEDERRYRPTSELIEEARERLTRRKARRAARRGR